MRYLLLLSALLFVGCGDNVKNNTIEEAEDTPPTIPLEQGESFSVEGNSTLSYTDDDTIVVSCNGGTCGDIIIYKRNDGVL